MRSLWRYNVITGLWDHVRMVAVDTAREWLAIWQRDEPDAHFKISKYRPHGSPIQ